MKLLLVVLFSLAGVQASATTTTGKVELRFDVVKTVHECISYRPEPEPNPGPGNCGYYQDINIGQSYAGFAIFEGEFTTQDGGISYEYEYFRGISSTEKEPPTCFFGDKSALGCNFSQSQFEGKFTEHSVEYSAVGSSQDYGAEYFWDIAAGSGWHTWEDDDLPYFGKGRFEFSNVVMHTTLDFASPPPPVDPPMAIPLPAGALLLLSGFAAAALVRSRRPGSA